MAGPTGIPMIDMQTEIQQLKQSRDLMRLEVGELMKKFSNIEKLLSSAVMRHSGTKEELAQARKMLASLSINWDEEKKEYTGHLLFPREG